MPTEKLPATATTLEGIRQVWWGVGGWVGEVIARQKKRKRKTGRARPKSQKHTHQNGEGSEMPHEMGPLPNIVPPGVATASRIIPGTILKRLYIGCWVKNTAHTPTNTFLSEA